MHSSGCTRAHSPQAMRCTFFCQSETSSRAGQVPLVSAPCVAHSCWSAYDGRKMPARQIFQAECLIDREERYDLEPCNGYVVHVQMCMRTLALVVCHEQTQRTKRTRAILKCTRWGAHRLTKASARTDGISSVSRVTIISSLRSSCCSRLSCLGGITNLA